MAKLLISACLLGHNVRYDGGNCLIEHPELKELLAAGEVISICPECAGGLSVPRPAANIAGKGGGASVLERRAFVKTENNLDVTEAFIQGAYKTLALAQKHNIKVAISKARSPSCGNLQIYEIRDTQRHLITGSGVTATLLLQHGIQVFNESQLEMALQTLKLN